MLKSRLSGLQRVADDTGLSSFV